MGKRLVFLESFSYLCKGTTKQTLMRTLSCILVALVVGACGSSRKMSREELARAVQEKVASCDYRVDIAFEYYWIPWTFKSRSTMGYIHIKGDTVISKMNYDYGYYTHPFPPKRWDETVKEKKYEMRNYRVEKRGRQTRVTFDFDYINLERQEWETCEYLLVFGRTQNVRVYQSGYPLNGARLRL